ncbi:DUF1418 family protein [Lacimicrobium alkaliphilum]|uniref:Uncharacterized protein n=1 Tax=Lacimicrobium alkaliphilum TaxID=1526571 RepID=A0ABQ1R406_9ALTE|nr:DUF1418 family protein [Lacimicrobium alkaliphilum]GGD55622.1 hypothetical protein GCM10011357_09040 [Lacimicrobium alkaliphilum]
MLKRFKKKLETQAVASVIIIPMIFFVIAFLALACYLSLRETLSPPLAALVTAAAGIVVIAIVQVLARFSYRRSTIRRAPQRTSEPEQDFEKLLLEHADPVLAKWIGDNPDKAAITTLLLGVAAGYSEAVRQALMDMYIRYSEAETQRRNDNEEN